MITRAERLGLVATHGITFMDIVEAAVLNSTDADGGEESPVRELLEQTMVQIGLVVGDHSKKPLEDVGKLVMSLSASTIVALGKDRDESSECEDCDGC